MNIFINCHNLLTLNEISTLVRATYQRVPTPSYMVYDHQEARQHLIFMSEILVGLHILYPSKRLCKTLIVSHAPLMFIEETKEL